MNKTATLRLRNDIPLADQCSHGRLWKEECIECEIVWLESMLPDAERKVMRDRARLISLRARLNSEQVQS